MAYRYDHPNNLVALIEDSVEKFSENPLFGTKNPAGDYEWVTYGQVGRRIDDLRGGLARMGVKKGDAVGIIADNRTEWAICAFAAYGLGARYIPMYEKELPQIWRYIIKDGNVRMLFVATPEIRERVNAFIQETPDLENVLLIDGQGENTMAALEAIGRTHPIPAIHPDPGDIAVLIYTSGTTGDPKGVLLSHGNFTTNFQAGGALYPELGPDSRSLCILPWAHSFGQTAELYNLIHFGGSMGFMGDVTTLAEDMGKVRPKLLVAVPRVFNKIYDGLWAKMNETGGLARKLFVMGVESARQRRELAEMGQSSFMVNLKFRLADRIVFQKIRNRFGGRLTTAITGSATMNVEIGHFFNDIGIPVYDCYGLTETTPAVTMNCPAAHRPGSVGRPIDQVRVEIDRLFLEEDADDGEIIVYGPNVMKGYNNKPDATREVMTTDGGFRTGDRGRLDADGYLYITGRIKEQYKLENGKYVFPTALEEEIRLLPWVENAMIYGEGKPYNVCMIVPDFVVLQKHARDNQRPEDPDQLVADSAIQEMIESEITAFLKGKFGGYEIPKKFLWVREDFSLENGTLTQTMKLKRRSVLEQYQDQLDALYA
ncbi:AMP-binding protein [Desulfosarcina alkanivorans]|uniref:AMP-binding protein n=1 Tax=Desulfosarcina alkanivorans TaxID=571177 RepID=A0A5K7YLB3_9BACT|nr:long-chain fatty acid--CoA ligase [Desulfosarcina alkanivorans]BBO69205.1 AMP-binding protein [Desulfosarcina alkanivorans]